MRVVVIGAGVAGVGSALAIQQAMPEVKVTIVADALSPDTTGDGAAGLWGLHNVAAAHPQKLARWGSDTHHFLHRLWREGDCPGIGIFSGVDVMEHELTPHEAAPFYCAEVPESPQTAPPSQVAPQVQVPRVCRLVTFFAEPAKFLPFLLNRFKSLGGDVVVATVTSLSDLAAYDVIVNCSGLGARQLVGDLTMEPVRGQLVRVHAPHVKTFTCNAAGYYVIPNGDVVILGGTTQRGDWRRAPDPADTARIVRECCRLVPAVRNSPVVAVWAGLRPYRPAGVRLERELCTAGGRAVAVVHNYGHGGAGVTLFWGCALETARLVRQHVLSATGASKL